MNDERLDDLIHQHLNDAMDDDTRRELEERLLRSAADRARFWELAESHALLHESLQRQPDDKATRIRRSWFQMGPPMAAAAGIVIGIFSASMVWAFTVPIAYRAVNRTIAVLSESFENPQFTSKRRFPTEANQWSGDLLAPVGAEGEVKPLAGSRMMRFMPPPNRKLGYARRIVDLADFPALGNTETRRLEISASFNTPGPAGKLHYQVRLAAFSQEPAAVRDIWNDESVLFDTVLQHVGRNVHPKPNDHGWQTVQASMEIPPGTRSVVISLAAGEADPNQPPMAHYLDAVQARFVISQAPVE